MKTLRLLTWITQLGLSVVVPPALCIWLAMWLRDAFGLGRWVVVLGIVLGVGAAVSGLWQSLRAMRLQAEAQERERGEKPPVSFNDHR